MNLDYDTYIFDYYGTLLDSYNDEKSLEYWEKWLGILDTKGIKHPDAETFMDEFFKADKKYRQDIVDELGFKYPEVDIIDVYRDLFEQYGNGELPDKLLYELAYDFRESTREYIKLYPGVDQYLKALRDNGKKLYILSNAQRAYTWPEITMFDMPTKVDGVVMSSDYGCMKPEAHLFAVICNNYGIDKNKAVMIGDSESSDIAGAKNYGMSYIHLTGDNTADKFYLKELGL